MSGLVRADSVSIPLRSESVDLIVTSPPYFALRSYTDGGEHYHGQIGSEPTPAEFVAALLEVTRECVRVLKPSGSIWVNLGDKYANTAPSPNIGKGSKTAKVRLGYRSSTGMGVRTKSLMGLPWRYALACIDDLGLILRAEVIWSKPNGLPESVTDRVRRSHEQWFHFTKEPRYFSAMDEIREPHGSTSWIGRPVQERHNSDRNDGGKVCTTADPLGKLPGSVRTVATEPLILPPELPDHFAAFPSEWPRWIISGWSPSGICVECGEGRRPVVEAPTTGVDNNPDERRAIRVNGGMGGTAWRKMKAAGGGDRITGESCACPTPDAPTRPAVVLDPFAGTGTTPAVANALGRYGIGIDLSADYLSVARWRCQDPGLRAKALGVDKPKPEVAGQLGLLDGVA